MGENPKSGVCRKRGSSQRFSLKYVDLGEKVTNFLQIVFSLPVLNYWLFLVGFFWVLDFFSIGFCFLVFFLINVLTSIFVKNVLMLQLWSFSLSTIIAELKLFSIIKTSSQKYAGNGILHVIHLIGVTFIYTCLC